MTTRNEPETISQDNRQKPKQERKKTSTSFVINILLTLLLLMMIAGIFFSLYTNLQLNQEIQTLTTETTTLKQQQLDTKTALNASLEILDATQVKANQRLSVLDKSLSSALQERWLQNNDWLLLKARYYLEMGKINANWTDNIETTVALLQQADVLLSNIHDSPVFVVRQAIAQEIAQQQAIPTVDVTGLLAKLDAAQHQLNDLPIKNPFTLTKNIPNEGSNNASLSSWHEHLQNSLRQLEKLVVIRHNNDSVEPLLAPEYQPILIESLRLNLHEAQWAVIQQHQAVYQLLLTQALEKINRSFDLNATITQSLIKQIHDLQQTSLNVKKTTQGQSLLLLNQVIESKKNPPPLLPPEATGNTNAPAAGDHS